MVLLEPVAGAAQTMGPDNTREGEAQDDQETVLGE